MTRRTSFNFDVREHPDNIRLRSIDAQLPPTESSPEAGVTHARTGGVKVVAGENTMHNWKLKRVDMRGNRVRGHWGGGDHEPAM